VSGFLTMYLAFLLRDKPISGIDGVVAAGAVIAAAGIGNTLGTLTGSLLRARKPEAVVLAVLLADTIVAVAVAVFYGFPLLIVLGLVAGLCSSLGKLSLDAMIQRDVPETVRTSVFARSETVLQLSWVIGGACGIVLPLIPRLGFGFLAAVLILAVVLVIRQKPAPHPPSRPRSTGSDGPSPRSTVVPTEHHETRPVHEPGTTRTILSTDPESIAERRAAGTRPTPTNRVNEPTVEIHLDQAGPASAPPTVGRWWSGQPAEDDDETVVDEAPWAADPTLENKPQQPRPSPRPDRTPEPPHRANPFRRRRPPR
jgi:hypothetical protein